MTIRVYGVIGLLVFVAGLWKLVLRRQFEILQQRDPGLTPDEELQDSGSGTPGASSPWESSPGDRDLGIALAILGLALFLLNFFNG